MKQSWSLVGAASLRAGPYINAVKIPCRDLVLQDCNALSRDSTGSHFSAVCTR